MPSLRTGQVIVPASGTPKQLPPVKIPDGFQVVIKAMKANTGTITVGYDSTSAVNTKTEHFKLAANESTKLSVTSLSAVWIDATVSGEGIEWICEYPVPASSP